MYLVLKNNVYNGKRFRDQMLNQMFRDQMLNLKTVLVSKTANIKTVNSKQQSEKCKLQTTTNKRQTTIRKCKWFYAIS